MTTIIISAGLDALPANAISKTTVALVLGSVTVPDNMITAQSSVTPTGQGILNLGTLTVTLNPGVGYTIKSSNALDTRPVSVTVVY